MSNNIFMRYRLPLGAMALALLIVLIAGVSPALADPETGQSVNVVFIGGSTLDTSDPCSSSGTAANTMSYTYGGCLPVTGPAGELGDFTFTAMLPADVSAASLAPYDTAVLNVASTAMACNTNTLSASQQADLVAFVAAGNKLIIYDSECYPGPVDYSWMPFPFTTSNPGAMGSPGTLTIVEDNLLSTNVAADPHFVDAVYLGTSTDAVGDMNVMTTFDPNWCVDMAGTNYNNVTGPVHTYADYPAGSAAGLFIYNGLDMDYLYYNDVHLRKTWVQELQQPFNPVSDLPCIVTPVGISITPEAAENPVGDDHTVTAMLLDLLGAPQVGIEVTFEVVSGPNAGAAGTCSANADCTTDANGEVSWTYTSNGATGTDVILASFLNQAGAPIYSQNAEKTWVDDGDECEGCLEAISLVSPADGAVLGSAPAATTVSTPPTFCWDPCGGTKNIFAIDFMTSAAGPPVFSKYLYKNLGNCYTLTQREWDRFNAGRTMYWRMRGADMLCPPKPTVIFSDEVWSFTK